MSDHLTITTSCPNCGKGFTLNADLLGRHGRCDACDSKFLIEEAPKPPQEPERMTAPANPVSSGKSSSSAGFGIAAVALLAVAGVGYLYFGTAVTTTSSTVVTSLSSTSAVAKTPTLPPLEKSFPVVEEFKELDIRQYLKTYPDVNMGWMPNKLEEAQEAMNWGNHLGPLGVRIRSYVPQHQGRAAFAAIVPDCLRSQDGRLALTAAEVVSIASGAPAEGYLQVGDLIVGVEGEMLKSGNEYRPEWEFMHKDARELQLMLGEKLDIAQARGDVRMRVMRYPRPEKNVFSEEMKQSDGRRDVSNVEVSAGDEIHLHVRPLDGNDYDHFTWLSPKLSGTAGTLDLADEGSVTPASASTGWGKLTRGKDITGKAVAEPCLTVHAESKMVFKVPPGYSTFSTGMLVTHAKADLKAEVVIVNNREALPVARQELWQGTGGNSSVGAQKFDVDLSGAGFFTLESSQFDEHIHGDGTRWCDVVFEGDYGTKNVLELPWESARAGYGRARVELEKPYTFKETEYAQSLDLHAQGEVTWKIPMGTKRVTGTFIATSHGKVQPKIHYTNLALPLTGLHKDKLVDMRIPVGKVGRYSATYPKDCKKTERTVKRHTEWLASQQKENGTWPRLRGYTSDGWDTAWCALALMSSGESRYDAQVKKAAYHIAYDSAPSEWTAERTMRLILLSEYYLRTKDDKILAGVQAAYFQLIDCCKNDYMAGHKVNGFGYGIAGQHYGTGHLALGVALAARTPITVDEQLVENIIRHAGEVCVNGTYAYGRGRRMRRDDSRRHSGGNAMSGPGLLGVHIGGGHTASVQEALERWEASLGDGDNSHASSSLAYIFTSLAMAATDEDLFIKHMQNFKYKMTIDDNWEGGYLKSAFALDLQGGEGVTSQWIRSAGSILTLNALKHNLAITGKKELMATTKIETPAVSEWGGQVHSYYLRNWCLANELLAENAPASLADAIAEMSGLERTMALVPETHKLVEKWVPAMVKTIAANEKVGELERAYAIELLSGLNFQLSTQLVGDKQSVELNVFLPMHQLNWLEEDKEGFFKDSSMKLKADITIVGSNLAQEVRFKIDSLDKFNFDQGTRKLKSTTALKDASLKEFDGTAQINFTLGGQTVSYKRPLKFNTLLVTKNGTNFRRLKLKLKTGPRAIFQSQPLIISGIAFDCMYPIETLPPVTSPEEGIIDVHEGDDVTVDISSENMICGTVNTLDYPQMSQVKHVPANSRKMIRGSVVGDMGAWTDHSGDTSATLKMDGGKAIVEYDFGKPVTINGLDMKDVRAFVRVWYHDGAQWTPLVWDNYSSYSNHNPVFPNTQAQRWRLEFIGRDLKLKTLRFYQNRHTVIQRQPLIQSIDSKFLPPIKPE